MQKYRYSAKYAHTPHTHTHTHKQIFFHVILNAVSIVACFLSAGMTGLYGSAAQLDNFSDFEEGSTVDCIFDDDSPLFSEVSIEITPTTYLSSTR